MVLATADSAVAKKHMKVCQKNGMDKLKAGLTFTKDVEKELTMSNLNTLINEFDALSGAAFGGGGGGTGASKGGAIGVINKFEWVDERNGGVDVTVHRKTYTTVWAGNPYTKYKLNGATTVHVTKPLVRSS